MSDDQDLTQDERDRLVFERLATEFGPELAMKNLEAKRAARAAGLPEVRPRTRAPRAGVPKKLDRDAERRVLERQAAILGLSAAEVQRLNTTEKARTLRTGGRRGYMPIRDTLRAFASSRGIGEKLAYDRCGRCGRTVPDRNDLGGQPLRCDPWGALGLVCCGFFDETGQRIDCYDQREGGLAEGHGRELAAAKRERAEKGGAEKARKGRGRQLTLVTDEQEGPPF